MQEPTKELEQGVLSTFLVKAFPGAGGTRGSPRQGCCDRRMVVMGWEGACRYHIRLEQHSTEGMRRYDHSVVAHGSRPMLDREFPTDMETMI